MIARVLISQSLETRQQEIEKALVLHIGGATNNHPDILYFKEGEKLGIEQARKIKEHFSLKPYQAKGRAVILEDASNLTTEAQNALLKTLEEMPINGVILLCASSEANFLPTVLSRCEINKLPPESYDRLVYHSKYAKDLQKLLSSEIPERFDFIEKCKEREEFLKFMVEYFHQNLAFHPFLKELLQAEGWAAQNVNLRAILEYLMLVLPKKS